MKNFICLLLLCYHVHNLNPDYCASNGCQNLKVSWLGCRWPNLWYKPCRVLDANGREGRFYKNLGGIVWKNCFYSYSCIQCLVITQRKTIKTITITWMTHIAQLLFINGIKKLSENINIKITTIKHYNNFGLIYVKKNFVAYFNNK